jgi:hypothetical protein
MSAGLVALIGRGGKYNILVVKPEGKRSPERPKRKDNIEIDFKEGGCGGDILVQLCVWRLLDSRDIKP